MDLKKKAQELTNYVKESDWGSSKCLKLELTSFQTGHQVGRGRNGVSRLLDLRTKVIEVESILIENSSRSNSIQLYINASVKETQGWGSNEEGIFIKIRNAKGKYSDAILIGTEKEKADRLKYLLNYPDLSTMDAEGFARFSQHKLEEFEESKKLPRIGEDQDLEAPSERSLKAEFTQQALENLVYPLTRGDSETFEKVLNHFGSKLSKLFIFTDRFWIMPDYANETRNGFEIGFTETGTYNSLPATIKIEKSTGVKTVKLSDLGIEGRGSYSHDDRMEILPEQVEKAKAFNKRFEANKHKRIDRVLKKAA